MKITLAILLAIMLISCGKKDDVFLVKDDFKHYIEKFNTQDTLNLHYDVIPGTKMISNDNSWAFLKDNIPFLVCPDKEIEEVYYYRWWTFRKHIKETPEGYVITEFMPNVSWAGKYNTIPCPAGHHFREGRWLHNAQIIKDYGLFWLRGGGNPYHYSFWISDSFLRYHMVHPNESLLIDVLPDLIGNFREWEKRRGEADGLFWQVDGADGMEVAIGGTGIRPTINTYMYADAVAISEIAAILDNQTSDIRHQFSNKAEEIRKKVLKKLWDEEDKFFKVMPRGTDSLSSARELLGYVPWYLGLVPPGQGYEIAWKQLMDPEGFFAPFGPTTAEQRHPGFSISYEGHECQWNGPSWPFATSQTLTALANVLNDYQQDYIDKEDFLETLKIFTRSHRFRQVPPAGDTIQSDFLWIDENLNPFNGDWLARTRMEVMGYNHGFRERGIYYNHSTYNDIIITGLAGLRPSLDNKLTVNPLIPADWDWFCLDNVLYKGHIITILWDRTGKKYNKGKGLRVYADGKLIGKSVELRKLEIEFDVKGEMVKQGKGESVVDHITISREVLLDKIKGGWAGQVIGCTYGGPTEFRYQGKIIPADTVIPWDETRMKWYFENAPGLYDDVYMDLTFVEVFEKEGLDAPVISHAKAFAHADYDLWHANQAARYNILNGILPPESGYWENNPHSDDIDFQIEADFAGLMSPGMINTASEISDSIGHIMNYGDGWYGGVYVAAMYSLAFLSDDVEYVVNEGLKTIPEQSDFYRCIADVIRWHSEYPGDWTKTWRECEEKWGFDTGCPDGVFRPFNIDAKINAAYIVIGLLYGNGDYGKTIDISTRCGQDSDCNPASAAGILGTILGYSNIPDYWKQGLDQVEDLDFRYTSVSMNDVYDMGFNHALENILRNGGREKGDNIIIPNQSPEPVRFEKGFEGHKPKELITIDESNRFLNHDQADFSFNFEGIGFVVKGRCEGEDYTAEIEVYIDDILSEKALLPSNFTKRRHEITWKYNLEPGNHNVIIKLINPSEKGRLVLNGILIYEKLPSIQHPATSTQHPAPSTQHQ